MSANLARSVLLFVAGWLSLATARADGCFVVPPFVWNKQKDINEPTQKAIILHDAGREDLILQVKYEGPVTKFGWLIPVPTLPAVGRATMDCFYEISRYTQEQMEPRVPKNAFMGAGAYGGGSGKPEFEPVKIIEVKTVGVYQVTVVSATDTGSLQRWLSKNSFSFPPDKTDVLASYLSRRWYFVAVKIDVGKGTGSEPARPGESHSRKARDSVQRKLATGELSPLHIAFDTPRCVFPLRISSANGTPSEVQLYVLSAEPLIEESVLEKELAELHRQSAQASQEISSQYARARKNELKSGMAGEFDPPEPPTKVTEEMLFDYDRLKMPSHKYARLTRQQLPICGSQLPRMGNKSWWLTKGTWQFAPEEMQDLEFGPAIPIFAKRLTGDAECCVALDLLRLGTSGTPALLEALQSSNPRVRVRAAIVIQEAERWAEWANGGWTTLLQDDRLSVSLCAHWDDPEPEVRKCAAGAMRRLWDAKYAEPLLKLLQDEDANVRNMAAWVLREHGEESSKYEPVALQMLKEEDPEMQASGLRALPDPWPWLPEQPPRTCVPREDLLRLLGTPHPEVVRMAYRWLCRDTFACSCEVAEPLLQNRVMLARVFGLETLHENGSSRAIEMAIPLLCDSEMKVRARAQEVLEDLTGQCIPQGQPAESEQWWAAHKASLRPVTEQEMVEGLGKLADHNDRNFPRSLLVYGGHPPFTFTDLIHRRIVEKAEREPQTDEQKKFWAAYHGSRQIVRFVHEVRAENSFRYLGEGAGLGDKDRIVFLYRAGDSENYRVVHADLSVTDARREDLPVGLMPESGKPLQR